MAASKLSSPTANLYRTSRLFSLPPPLPRPISEIAPASDTATLPYPIHAAIQAPASSLSRGDWGLKRPLPLKKLTNVSEPTIRALNLDEVGGTTDFESSGDHVQTLRKFQNLDIPVLATSTRQITDYSSIRGKSAFDLEGRDPDGRGGMKRPSMKHVRPANAQPLTPSTMGSWKHAGPRLVDLDALEFNTFVNGAKPQKEAFQTFLKEKAAEGRAELVARLSREQKGRQKQVAVPESSEEEVFREYLNGLRKRPGDLDALIAEFFDLIPSPTTPFGISQYSKQTPSTAPLHRSAGLSYLRTAGHVPNHPYYGPQDYPEPVEARVLASQSSRNNQSSSRSQAQIGVGGFVTLDNQLASHQIHERLAPDVKSFRPDQPGGGKMLVKPNSASVDIDGRIIIGVERPRPDAINVKELVQYKKDAARGVIPRTYDYLPDLSAPVGIRKGIVQMRESAKATRRLVAKPAKDETDIDPALQVSESLAKQLAERQSQEEGKNGGTEGSTATSYTSPEPSRQQTAASQNPSARDPQKPKWVINEDGLKVLDGTRQHDTIVGNSERFDDWNHMVELLAPVKKQ